MIQAADRFDLDEQTERLRRLGLRAAGFGMIWLACFAAGVLVLIAADNAAQRLLDTGTRVPGQVVSVQRGKNNAIQVRYRPVGSKDVRVVRIAWDSSRDYASGDEVTVVYDPADQARIRTTGERNLDDRSSWAPAVVLFVAAVLGMPFVAMAAAGWRRRYRAVRATGWRTAIATRMVYERERSRKLIAVIEVEYPDGGTAELEPVASLHGALGPVGKAWRVWVGGRDTDMVVLYPRGRWRDKPLAVPVTEKSARRARPRHRSW
ncbi:DUF3592 domain-containing protein [Kutzneria sp. NPDC051319]|uniref:DUF3592 domain-containing protein n=1 Tax=Kutzneria sp. NPDC051319 TaxID=3155047 RepID=UPI0034343A57